MASVALSDKQKFLVTAQALDAAGVQVDFTAPPVFSVSDAALGNLVELSSTDPLPPTGQFQKWFVALADGSGTISVSEDAVLGDDTTKITGTLDFVISAPIAVAASIAVTGSAAAAQP